MKPELTLEVIYPYPPERVWRALTEPPVLAQWLLPNSFEPRVGHRFQFVRPVPGSAGEVIECEVIALQPPFRLAYTWRGPADPAPSVVTWTLQPVAGGTRLRLAHTRADEATAAHKGDAAAAARAWEHRLASLRRALRFGVRKRASALSPEGQVSMRQGNESACRGLVDDRSTCRSLGQSRDVYGVA
jgi:uncharacterized protein YndB with AHSA1/START domain